MVSEFLANQVCEKLVKDIKNSHLNYLVNETPYSAYITIRKKFTKAHADLSNVTLVPNSDVSLESSQAENKLLRVECTNLKEECNALKNKNRVLEDKLAGYAEENVSFNQKLFILKGEISIQQNESQSLKDKLKVKLRKIEELEKLNLDKDDNIEMLNSIIKNKNLDLQTPQTETSLNLQVDSFKCDQCDFTSESSKGLKIHLGRVHEVRCDTCNEKFGGIKKLKAHTCRIHVANPSSEFCYMKNWYVKNECIRVFCEMKKELLAVLHSEECYNIRQCSEFPSNLEKNTTVKDKEGIIHTYADKNINVDTVCWDTINFNLHISDHITVAEP